jgi:hypothetical protein
MHYLPIKELHLNNEQTKGSEMGMARSIRGRELHTRFLIIIKIKWFGEY